MITLSDVHKNYPVGETIVRALDGVSTTIQKGGFVAVTGPSGCGKSTFLNLLGGLDRPTSGSVVVDGVPLHSADEKELTAYRRERLGIVFQFFNLLPSMTVAENVELPLLLRGDRPGYASRQALQTLELVGLAPRARHFPHQLSGGQMQRAALARALVHRPALLLADEPTGNLDSENAARVLEILRTISAEGMATIVLVTHSEAVACSAKTRIRMLDGRIIPNNGEKVLDLDAPREVPSDASGRAGNPSGES